MKKLMYSLLLIITYHSSFSQNDEDVIRYSNIGIGGTPRFLALGGAMGALGGDMSCASYNPAGLGISIRSDLNFAFGLNFANTRTDMNGFKNQQLSPALTFNFLGLSGTAADSKNPDNRYTFAFTLNQLQNFNQEIEIKGRPTKGKSITLDMLDNAKGKSLNNLDPLYEGMAYNIYVLDLLDTNNLNSYFSYIDTSKSFLQQNKISKSGRINELAFSFGYSIEDRVYLGGTLAVPFLKFSYQSDYAEIDDENQMYIKMNSDSTFTSSYSYPVFYYKGLGGIKEFHYQTTYTTTATGVNIKIGAIWRASDFIRIGLYYHSPTWYKAKDVYFYDFSSTWDEGQSFSYTVPEGGGLYNYRITTPSKIGIALSGIYSNKMSFNCDYELVDYRRGSLRSSDIGVFDNANKALREKYTMTGNLKAGIELNTKPIIFRIGWASYGSPFGQQISGNYVRNAFSIGAGFKTSDFYFDLAIIKAYAGKQVFYMYNPKYSDPANIQLNLTQIIFSIGLIGKRYDENIDYEKYNQSTQPNSNPPQNSEPGKNRIPY
ncbi:MAG: hemin receptor [Bacteroidia bacterium]|nr:MAG: hemin receptor [Bacteroidia bacterium]